MPMPHRTQMQVIKRRLVGKDGSERTSELRAILAELPGYRNGPYADIRKWVQSELAATRVRARVVHRDLLAVRREGAAQVALVGAPNAGSPPSFGRSRRSRSGPATTPSRRRAPCPPSREPMMC